MRPGWLAVYGREAQEDDANLVPVDKGEVVRTESVDVKSLATKPRPATPKRPCSRPWKARAS